MQVFKLVFKIFWRHKHSFFLYIGIFMALAIGLSQLGSEDQTTAFEASKCKVAVFDYDNTKSSEKFLEYLKGTVEIKKYEDDKETLVDHMFTRHIEAVIYIEEGFEEQLLKGNTENLVKVSTLPGTVQSQVVGNCVSSYMNPLHAYLETGMELSEAMDSVNEVMEVKADVDFSSKKVSDSKSPIYYFMLYLPYVLIAVTIQCIGACITKCNRKEVRDRMNVSAYTFMKKNLGMWGGIVILELAFVLLFVILSSVMYKNDLFTMGRLMMIINIISFALVALGLTFLLGTLVKKENGLDMVSNVFSLGMSFLGGIFVPVEFLGDGVKMVSHFMPTYWYVSALEMIETGEFLTKQGAFVQCIGVQLAFAAAFLALGLVASRMTRKSK